MKQTTFNSLCERIYSAFGKNAPSENSTVQRYLFDRISFIGDEYAGRIGEALESTDKMPSNLGSAIIAVYYSLTDEKKREKKECDRCHNNSGYYWFVHPKNGGSQGYSVKCPYCNGGDTEELYNQTRAGAKIVPSGECALKIYETFNNTEEHYE